MKTRTMLILIALLLGAILAPRCSAQGQTDQELADEQKQNAECSKQLAEADKAEAEERWQAIIDSGQPVPQADIDNWNAGNRLMSNADQNPGPSGGDQWFNAGLELYELELYFPAAWGNFMEAADLYEDAAEKFRLVCVDPPDPQ